MFLLFSFFMDHLTPRTGHF